MQGGSIYLKVTHTDRKAYWFLIDCRTPSAGGLSDVLDIECHGVSRRNDSLGSPQFLPFAPVSS